MPSNHSSKDKLHPEFADNYNAPDTMPDNVNELLSRVQLDNARDVHRLIEARSKLNPYQDRELAVKIIQKLIDYHISAIDKRVEKREAEYISAWAADLKTLEITVSLLESVELSDE